MALKIILCLPGSNFSGKFLDAWTETIHFFGKNNIAYMVSHRESNNIYFVRNMCLGGDFSRGKEQRPFNGQVEYDYLLWIDSDIIFRPAQIIKLVNHNADIVSGLYLMDEGEMLCHCQRMG
ncbi:MAG: hypothetical protein A2293_10680 [Elusimicrobia bacterium RIFOXYB2_FULL_49_7]|nr:MAG: hypothetical protein A2293_10680 [Elusimicrobia bacterium RIFOXYB2_FULL_49_7]